MEEYKALRAEVLLLKQQNFTIQKWVTVTLGIIYGLAYGITPANSFLPKLDRELLLFAGLGTWAFGAFIYYVSDYTIYSIGEYIEQIEAHFANDTNPKGWEHFHGLKSGRQYVRQVTRSPFWWLALVVSAGAILLHRLGVQL
jgi:hypothetical protein